MNRDSQLIIEDCYIQYCSVIKPLIARIEALSEKIPLAIFNEIRAFNDHIARCYFNNPNEEYIEEQISKAQRHILRITLDCFKCINVLLYMEIEEFERRTKNVDLTVIDNGLFYPEYIRKKQEAAFCVERAKIAEGLESNKSLDLYEEACNLYSEILDKIHRIEEKVKWAKVRFTTKKIATIVGTLANVRGGANQNSALTRYM